MTSYRENKKLFVQWPLTSHVQVVGGDSTVCSEVLEFVRLHATMRRSSDKEDNTSEVKIKKPQKTEMFGSVKSQILLLLFFSSLEGK